jgi:regulator of replication initiation timing
MFKRKKGLKQKVDGLEHHVSDIYRQLYRVNADITSLVNEVNGLKRYIDTYIADVIQEYVKQVIDREYDKLSVEEMQKLMRRVDDIKPVPLPTSMKNMVK